MKLSGSAASTSSAAALPFRAALKLQRKAGAAQDLGVIIAQLAGRLFLECRFDQGRLKV